MGADGTGAQVEPENAGVDFVDVASDSTFQRHLRQLQSKWREDHGLPMGTHRGRPLGSRLAMPFAEETLANYLTPTIRGVVRREVIEGGHGERKLYSRPRIFDDLLSSQPLCFNLFGELSVDLAAATAVARSVRQDRIGQVTAIEFEWSPGRDDPRYLANRSAFDVMLFHTTPEGSRGFIGIEVKYHENLQVSPARMKPRYDDVATGLTRGVSVFGAVPDDALYRPPLQQIWLDHLLALSMLQSDDYDTGLFVLLHPAGNRPCVDAARRYSEVLHNSSTFENRTIEGFLAEVTKVAPAPWVAAFKERYLAGADVSASPAGADVNPMPEVQDFDDDEEFLARFVVGAIRTGGTMFLGRLYECRVARLLGGKLAPRGVWPWDVRLSDGTQIEVRSGARSFSLDGGRGADVWVFVRKSATPGDGTNPICYYVASNEAIDRLRERGSKLSLAVAEEELRRCDDLGLFEAVEAVTSSQS